jgi:hypothetical protein
MEEVVVAVFDDLGTVNGARISVRLVYRRGQLFLDIRKMRNGAYMPQGVELPTDMVRRLHAQYPAILAKLLPDSATLAPAPTASQPSRARRRRERRPKRPA